MGHCTQSPNHRGLGQEDIFHLVTVVRWVPSRKVRTSTVVTPDTSRSTWSFCVVGSSRNGPETCDDSNLNFECLTRILDTIWICFGDERF